MHVVVNADHNTSLSEEATGEIVSAIEGSSHISIRTSPGPRCI